MRAILKTGGRMLEHQIIKAGYEELDKESCTGATSKRDL